MNTQETLELLKTALGKTDPAILQKAGWTQSNSATSGLTAYDLEAPAKTLYPVITPLRNMLPRVSARGGIQANWRAITALNTANLSAGVSEGNRGGTVSTEVKDYYAAYRGIGLEDSVTFEAEYAAEGFDDVKARSTEGLLRALMIQEERVILGGNGTLALGTTPTPSLSVVDGGGSIADSTDVTVICAALTLDGYHNNSVANGVNATIVRTNADGSSDTISNGVAQKSAAGTVNTGTIGNDAAITATVAYVKGAVGYAWYVGTAGTEKLAAITTIPKATFTALPGTGQAATELPAADHSVNSLVFDGFLSLAAAGGSNAYWNDLGGSGLTAGTDGTITEIDAALQHFWDTYKLSPTLIYVSSQEMNYLRKKVLEASSTAGQRFVFSANQQGFLGGTAIKGYTNPFTMGDAEDVPIRIHPNLPAGTMMFLTQKLPYQLSGVTNVNQIRARQEYYAVEWPQRSRKWEYGVYADEVLQCYATFSLGVISGIGAE